MFHSRWLAEPRFDLSRESLLTLFLHFLHSIAVILLRNIRSGRLSQQLLVEWNAKTRSFSVYCRTTFLLHHRSSTAAGNELGADVIVFWAENKEYGRLSTGGIQQLRRFSADERQDGAKTTSWCYRAFNRTESVKKSGKWRLIFVQRQNAEVVMREVLALVIGQSCVSSRQGRKSSTNFGSGYRMFLLTECRCVTGDSWQSGCPVLLCYEIGYLTMFIKWRVASRIHLFGRIFSPGRIHAFISS